MNSSYTSIQHSGWTFVKKCGCKIVQKAARLSACFIYRTEWISIKQVLGVYNKYSM